MNENNISHYHLLIIDNAAHAALLPFLHDPERVKPLLHREPFAGEHLLCIAQAMRSFEEILEKLKSKTSLLFEHTVLKLPYQIPALRIDVADEKIAHKILEILRDRYIQALTNQDDSEKNHSEPALVENILSPGHYLLHPTPLHFVPYS